MDNQSNGINLQKEDNIGQSFETNAAEIYPGAPAATSAAPSPAQLANTPGQAEQPVSTRVSEASNTKFCKFCGAHIPMDAVLCTSCGRQVELLQGANPSQQPQIVINNANTSTNTNTNTAVASAAVGVPIGRKKSKWVCLALWCFLGLFGGHKFYDGKIGSGILYMFTAGFFMIGWIIDLFAILNRPNPYYIGY